VFPLAKFSEYIVTCWKREGLTPIIKAIEAFWEKGGLSALCYEHGTCQQTTWWEGCVIRRTSVVAGSAQMQLVYL
jgi:hypothetical protein